MAKRVFQYKGVRLTYRDGEPCAAWDEDGKRVRVRLAVGPGAKEEDALVAWVEAQLAQKMVHHATLLELMRAYLEHRRDEGKVLGSGPTYMKKLAPTFGGLRPNEVSEVLCKRYAKARFDAGKSPSTVWSELKFLRNALTWAVKMDYLPKLPVVWIPTPSEPRDRVATPAELEAILAACRSTPHMFTFATLAATTGARSGAIVDLTWDRVDFDNGVLDFNGEAVRNPMLKVVQKGRARGVPIVPIARLALLEAKATATSRYVCEYRGKKLDHVWRKFTDAIQSTGIKDVTPHTLRHTVASYLLAADIDMEQIAKQLGHSDTATTRRVYAHQGKGYLDKAGKVIADKVPGGLKIVGGTG